jgi:hypothetical protein
MGMLAGAPGTGNPRSMSDVRVLIQGCSWRPILEIRRAGTSRGVHDVEVLLRRPLEPPREVDTLDTHLTAHFLTRLDSQLIPR